MVSGGFQVPIGTSSADTSAEAHQSDSHSEAQSDVPADAHSGAQTPTQARTQAQGESTSRPEPGSDASTGGLAERAAGNLERLELAVGALVAAHEQLMRELAVQSKELTALVEQRALMSLEQASLVDQCESLTAQNLALEVGHSALERQLVESSETGRVIEQRLAREGARRGAALARVDALIGRITELRATAGPAKPRP